MGLVIMVMFKVMSVMCVVTAVKRMAKTVTQMVMTDTLIAKTVTRMVMVDGTEYFEL